METVQSSLDSRCEDGLSIIRSLRGDKAADSPLLDGRAFSAQEALEADFIDRIAEGPDVFQSLLERVKNS